MSIHLPKKSGSRRPRPVRNRQRTFNRGSILFFWLKTDEEVKAIVEIKRAWGKKPVMDDIYKLWEYRKTKDGRTIRYYHVLYYTDHSRKDRWKGEDSKFIQDRFCKVDKEIKEGTGRDKHNVGLRHRPADYICDPDKDDLTGVRAVSLLTSMSVHAIAPSNSRTSTKYIVVILKLWTSRICFQSLPHRGQIRNLSPFAHR